MPCSRYSCLGEVQQAAAEIGLVGLAVLVQHMTEDQHLAGAEDVGGHPVEGPPVDAQPQIALGDAGEPADGRPVEGQLVGLQQELLVVVEHVEAALEVGEGHGDGLDPLFLLEILAPLGLDLVHGHPVLLVLLGLQVELLELFVGNLQEFAQFGAAEVHHGRSSSRGEGGRGRRRQDYNPYFRVC